MARYAVNNIIGGGSEQALTSATYKTLVVVTALTGATTLRRGWIDEVIVGGDANANSTDTQILWDWSVQTAAGTVTATTPNPTPDGSDAAALLVYGTNATAEGTITANSSLLAFPTNQRQSQRIQYADYRLSPLIVPAVTLKGIAGRAKSPTYVGTAQLQEYVTE
jgi:hypothetical protein